MCIHMHKDCLGSGGLQSSSPNHWPLCASAKDDSSVRWNRCRSTSGRKPSF